MMSDRSLPPGSLPNREANPPVTRQAQHSYRPNRYDPDDQGGEEAGERTRLPERKGMVSDSVVLDSGDMPPQDVRTKPTMREWDIDRERDNDLDMPPLSVSRQNIHRKRRRSPSQSGRYSPPPAIFQPSLYPFSSEPIDPALIPTQLGFKEFTAWFHFAHPNTAKADDDEFRQHKRDVEDGLVVEGPVKERVGLGKRYERYRKEYTSRQLFTLYLTHRQSAWFIERYSPLAEDAAERKRVDAQGRTSSIAKYIEELRAGRHDAVSYDQPKGMKRISEPDRYSSQLEPRDRPNDESGLEVMPPPNQILIRSVPPNLRRADLEHLFRQFDGLQYLALSDPNPKRSFHRIAWVQYAPEVDIEDVAKQLDDAKIDTFTLHLGVNTTPATGRIRYAPLKASSLSRLEKDGEMAKALALKLENDLESDVVPEGQVGEMAAASPAAEPASREKGSAVVSETIERVLRREGLDGELSSDEQRVKKAKITLDHWISYLRHGLSTCYYCVAPSPFPEELNRRCVGHQRQTETPAPGHRGTAGGNQGADVNMDEASKEGSLDQLHRKIEEVKRTGIRVSEGRYSDERWEESLDGKLAPLIREVDVVDYGGRDIEKETKTLTAPTIKQETAIKYRCKECNKLFKAEEFVVKHVVAKHGEEIQPKLDELAMFNNFVLDPQRLQLSSKILGAVNDQLPANIDPLLPIGMGQFNPAFAASAAAATASGAGINAAQSPQQMMAMMLQMQQAMMAQMASGGAVGNAGGGRGARSGDGRRDMGGMGGGSRQPAPPRTGEKEDPRAKRAKVSYRDWDVAGGGAADGGLPY